MRYTIIMTLLNRKVEPWNLAKNCPLVSDANLKSAHKSGRLIYFKFSLTPY